jgi:FkbM family methyltransferase
MKKNIRQRFAGVVRRLSGPLVFRKSLPPEFGGAALYVTSRADMRLLYPGYRRSANDLLMVARKYIRPGNCIWDIGSNLGIFSFCAAFMTGKNGRVFTVEADPRYAELQNRTISRLPVGYANVTTLCAAVADRDGILELSIPKNGHARNHLSVVAGNAAAETESTKSVVSVSCDFLLKHWPAPDFVKMDIEGAELLALKGANRLLEVIRPVIYIEVGEQTRLHVTELLRRFKYRLFRLNQSGEEVEISECAFDTVAIPEPG